MRLPEFIIKMLRKKSGNDLYLPSDCEFLSLDIESNLGIHIGATTLKRLLGFANDERTPHASTLEVLAKYLGYAHWRDVIHQEARCTSGFNSPKDEIRSSSLSVGDRIDLTYSPDRHVVFEYVGDDYFVVVSERETNWNLVIVCKSRILSCIILFMQGMFIGEMNVWGPILLPLSRE